MSGKKNGRDVTFRVRADHRRIWSSHGIILAHTHWWSMTQIISHVICLNPWLTSSSWNSVLKLDTILPTALPRLLDRRENLSNQTNHIKLVQSNLNSAKLMTHFKTFIKNLHPLYILPVLVQSSNQYWCSTALLVLLFCYINDYTFPILVCCCTLNMMLWYIIFYTL